MDADDAAATGAPSGPPSSAAPGLWTPARLRPLGQVGGGAGIDSPARLAALVSDRHAAVAQDQTRRLETMTAALRAAEARAERAEAYAEELASELRSASAAREAMGRLAEAAISRADASEVEVEALQAEVATLAAAAREVALFERGLAQAEREGRVDDHAVAQSREEDLKQRVVAEVDELAQRHEVTLRQAVATKEAAFERERDAIRRAAARERIALTKSVDRAELRVAELEHALATERSARQQEAASCLAAVAAEAEAMEHAVSLGMQLDAGGAHAHQVHSTPDPRQGCGEANGLAGDQAGGRRGSSEEVSQHGGPPAAPAWLRCCMPSRVLV